MKRVRLNNRARRAFRGSSRGFTLIEVVIAIALLGIIGAAVLSALSTASLALINADKRATSESLARSQMEYVKTKPYSGAPTEGVGNYAKTTDDIPNGYTIWSVSRNGTIVNGGPSDPVIGIPWDSGNNTAAYEDKGLQKITVIVKFDDEVLVTLEDYKREPVT